MEYTFIARNKEEFEMECITLKYLITSFADNFIINNDFEVFFLFLFRLHYLKHENIHYSNSQFEIVYLDFACFYNDLVCK